MNADLPIEWLDAATDLRRRPGSRGWLRIRGESMRPTVAPGRAVAVEFGAERIRFGDLVLFRQADYLVVHRCLGRARAPDGRPCLRTRGDGVQTLDPALDPARVLGRAIAVERDDGWRSLVGAAARAYAAAVAAHELFWSAAVAVARRLERGPGRRGLGDLLGRADRGLLAAADRVFFGPAHSRIDPSCDWIPPDSLGGGGKP